MKKLNNKQAEVLDEVLDEIISWRNTENINSRKHLTRINKRLEKLALNTSQRQKFYNKIAGLLISIRGVQ